MGSIPANIQTALNSTEVKKELARRKLVNFASFNRDDYDATWYHKSYAAVLDKFVSGEIERVIVQIPPQHGKALCDNTPILTTNGWVNHGGLKVGDYVFGKDGTPVIVEAVQVSYLHECQKLTCDGSVEIIAAKQHEWLVGFEKEVRRFELNDKGQNVWTRHKRIESIVETQNIFAKKQRRSPSILLVDGLVLPFKKLPIDPYILGCWIGDGSSGGGAIVSGNEDYRHFYNYGDGKRIRIDDHRILVKGLQVLLKKNNLFNNKHIPDIYLLGSKEQRLELLRGLMDTDGYIDTRGTCEFCTIKKHIAESVYTLLFSLGIKCSIIEGDATLNGRFISKKYRVCFNPDKTETIFKLARKQSRLNDKTRLDRRDKKKMFIKSVENVGIKSVKCIQVQGGYYLAGRGLTLTHNSLLCSQLMPAYLLGKNPDKKIAITSYNHEFTATFNREVQRIIESDSYKLLFPNTRLNGKNVVTTGSWLKNASQFEIVGRKGSLKSVGVGGSLTGSKVEVSIVDDPYKDREDAFSAAYERKLRNWWDTVLTTRLHKGAQICLTLTRWKDDDIVDYVLSKSDGHKWHIVKYEAIKETEKEYDPREIGEALWEVRHEIEKLKRIKKDTPLVFQSMYQQNPTKQGGNVILSKYFQNYSINELPRGTIHCYIDPALSGKELVNNDPTGMLFFQIYQNNLYLVHYEEGLWTLHEIVEKIKKLGSYHLNNQSKIWIENKASGKSVDQEIRRLTGFNIILDDPIGDKMARVQLHTPKMEGRRLFIPMSESWSQPFIDNCGAFPNAVKDERVDCLTGAFKVGLSEKKRYYDTD